MAQGVKKKEIAKDKQATVVSDLEAQLAVAQCKLVEASSELSDETKPMSEPSEPYNAACAKEAEAGAKASDVKDRGATAKPATTVTIPSVEDLHSLFEKLGASQSMDANEMGEFRQGLGHLLSAKTAGWETITSRSSGKRRRVPGLPGGFEGDAEEVGDDAE